MYALGSLSGGQDINTTTGGGTIYWSPCRACSGSHCSFYNTTAIYISNKAPQPLGSTDGSTMYAAGKRLPVGVMMDDLSLDPNPPNPSFKLQLSLNCSYWFGTPFLTGIGPFLRPFTDAGGTLYLLGGNFGNSTQIYVDSTPCTSPSASSDNTVLQCTLPAGSRLSQGNVYVYGSTVSRNLTLPYWSVNYVTAAWDSTLGLWNTTTFLRSLYTFSSDLLDDDRMVIVNVGGTNFTLPVCDYFNVSDVSFQQVINMSTSACPSVNIYLNDFTAIQVSRASRHGHLRVKVMVLPSGIHWNITGGSSVIVTNLNLSVNGSATFNNIAFGENISAGEGSSTSFISCNFASGARLDMKGGVTMRGGWGSNFSIIVSGGNLTMVGFRAYGGTNLRLLDSVPIIITNSSFSYSRGDFGGAIHARGNEANVAGGAIYVQEGNLTVDECRFTSNASPFGGAINSDRSTTSITESFFLSNKAMMGGAYADGSMCTRNCSLSHPVSQDIILTSYCNINNTVFQSNQAQSEGGAIYSMEDSVIKVIGCRFDSNVANASGGAISATNSTLEINYCNFSLNIASIWGGAIYTDRSRFLSLVTIVFEGNTGMISDQAVYAENPRAYSIRQLNFSFIYQQGCLRFNDQLNPTILYISQECPTGPIISICPMPFTLPLSVNDGYTSVNVGWPTILGGPCDSSTVGHICTNCFQRLLLRNMSYFEMYVKGMISSTAPVKASECLGVDLEEISSSLNGINYTSHCPLFTTAMTLVGETNAFPDCFVSSSPLSSILSGPNLTIPANSTQLFNFVNAVGNFLERSVDNGTVSVPLFFQFVEQVTGAVLRNSSVNQFSVSSPSLGISARREVIDGSQNVSLQINGSSSILPGPVLSTALQRGGLTIDVPVVSLLTSFKTNPFRSIRSQDIYSNVMGLSVYAEGNRLKVNGTERTISIDMMNARMPPTDYELVCLHWDEVAKNWSTDGCSLFPRNFGYSCVCSHLTNFTLGIQPVIQPSTTQDHTKLIAIIAGVVGGLLLLFVLIVVILLVRRKSKGEYSLSMDVIERIPHDQIRFDEKIYKSDRSIIYKGVYGLSQVTMKRYVSTETSTRVMSVIMKLHHPNILQFLGMFDDEMKRMWLVLEYTPQGTIENYLRDHTLKEEQVVKTCADVASALYYLEENGLVLHSPVSISTVLVQSSREGEIIPKLSDFSHAVYDSNKLDRVNAKSFGFFLWEMQHKETAPSRDEPHSGFKWSKDIYTDLAEACLSDFSSDRPRMSSISSSLKEKCINRYSIMGLEPKAPNQAPVALPEPSNASFVSVEILWSLFLTGWIPFGDRCVACPEDILVPLICSTFPSPVRESAVTFELTPSKVPSEKEKRPSPLRGRVTCNERSWSSIPYGTQRVSKKAAPERAKGDVANRIFKINHLFLDPIVSARCAVKVPLIEATVVLTTTSTLQSTPVKLTGIAHSKVCWASDAAKGNNFFKICINVPQLKLLSSAAQICATWQS
ncbi:hypothetical protein PROFUN_16260 [Planoprotostelium fungivorum]|uniref:Uncharacterized protein n=1 Tax=Planoprotostelium fungivorum TaxID=1890364 RepID=A0A2P6MRP7_9EUKA|nr:hypothetical protein PROFUN_16260 [Planoprotostelium fungivorum]